MKKVLIVVDMQNDFIIGSLGSNEAKLVVAGVATKIKEYKRNGDIIVFTRDTHNDGYLNTQEGKFLPVVHCVKDTIGWEIYDEIKELIEPSMAIIDKPTFGSMELATKIKNLSNSEEIEVELVGVCTDICVVSNALILKAFLPEAGLKVDASCCAGVTVERHKSALETLKSCQITIINE